MTHEHSDTSNRCLAEGIERCCYEPLPLLLPAETETGRALAAQAEAALEHGPLVAEIVQRGQHAKRGRSGFSGPDAYVAVVVRRADGASASLPLDGREAVMRKRGWVRIVNCGQGYRQHAGPRSALGRAWEDAMTYCDAHGLPRV